VDADGNPELHYPGDYNTAVPGHRDIAYRQGVLEQEGVTTQIVSLTTPGTHVETPARAVKYASMVNDEFAKDVQERSPRFAAYATLPLNDPKASVVEFRRAVEQLKFPGAMLFSNVNGVALADERYWPLYEAAMKSYWLMPLVGFLFDTTIAAAHLVYSGVNERFPRIRWVASHLGGALPYLAERLDRGYEAFPECRANIPKPPSEYLRHWYYDTVNFDPRAIELAVKFAGADHILAGSDYPHAIGSIPSMMKALNAIQVSDADRAAIFGGNAVKLYNLG
jgi:aminocarboxymuconate-semialdehyde decarboxylase